MLKNRDYEQGISNAGSSLSSSTDDIVIQAGAGKQTQILNSNGDPIATFDDATKKTTLDNIEVANGVTVGGNEQVNGNSTIDGTQTVKGDVVLGDSAGDTVTVKGDQTTEGDQTIEGTANLKGNTVLGTDVGDTITVKGSTTFQENTTLQKDVEVGGDTKLNGNVTLGDSTSDVITFKGTPTFTNVGIDGDLSVDGDTTIGDNSNDNLTINATTAFKELVKMEKDLTVDHDVFLGSDNGDILVVKSTPTFKENATFEKEVNLRGNVIIGTSSSNTLTVKSGVTCKSNHHVDGNSIVEGTFLSEGNCYLGKDSSNIVKAYGVIEATEDAKFNKKIILNTDGGDDFITYNATGKYFEWYKDGALFGTLKGGDNDGGYGDLHKIVQSISRSSKTYSPLPTAFEDTVSILEVDYSGGNIDTANLLIDTQGEIAHISFQFHITNLNEQVPSTKHTTLKLHLLDILKDCSPITKIYDGYCTSTCWYELDTNDPIPFNPLFSKVEGNELLTQLMFEVPESKFVTYGTPKTVTGMWFWGQISLRVKIG